MKPEPLASCGCVVLLIVEVRKKSSMPGGDRCRRCRAARPDAFARSARVSIETTAGRHVVGDRLERRTPFRQRTRLRAARRLGAGAVAVLRPAESREIEPGREDESAQERDDDRGAKAARGNSLFVMMTTTYDSKTCSPRTILAGARRFHECSQPRRL